MSKKRSNIEEEGIHEVSLDKFTEEFSKWNRKIESIEHDTQKLLQIKRHRDLTGFLDNVPRSPLHVYLDYWIKDERIIPISVRIYHNERQTVECFVYEVKQELLLEIKNYYSKRSKRPYWVDFISDTSVNFVIALSSHFEKYDISWIPNENTVNYILRERYVKLFVIFDNAHLIEKHYECIVLHVYYVRSEDVYKVDFIKDYKGIKQSSVDYNNMIQSISSIRIRIEKVISNYPNIVDEFAWKDLLKFFKN